MKPISVFTICLLLAVTDSMVSMAMTFPMGTLKEPASQKHKQAEPSARFPVERHEIEVQKLLRKASRAEEKAVWHAQQAQAWDNVAKHQNSLGDFASAKEPMAGFLAHLHREQHEQSLRQAVKSRQAAHLLKENAARVTAPQ
jgi:hypothetical protein